MRPTVTRPLAVYKKKPSFGQTKLTNQPNNCFKYVSFLNFKKSVANSCVDGQQSHNLETCSKPVLVFNNFQFKVQTLEALNHVHICGEKTWHHLICSPVDEHTLK